MAPASDRDLATGFNLDDASREWWKDACIYQIYPASFFDSNNDGIGDVNGITMNLDYIKNLGADTIWVSPIYKSPQVDMGYDISDYADIHEPFGTMEDVVKLTEGIHKRGMRLVMDLVVNHTSDKHEWFRHSRSSKDNPYRDWYIWRPGQVINGKLHPPNNWKGMFGGSTWEFDSLTGEFYLHCFAVEQPDLNWENPAVVQAVHNIVRFWLDRGVDGFRMDVINFISKTPGYPDAPTSDPTTELQDASGLFANGPRLHEHLKGLGALLRSYNAFSVGEMPFARKIEDVLEVVSSKSGELNMIFQFDVVDMDIGDSAKFSPKVWDLRTLKNIVNKWQTSIYRNSGWSANFCENHDQARSVSRFASDTPEHRVKAAKLLCMWLACQSGTLFIYQGQELGMRNVPAEWQIEEYKDIETQNSWAEYLQTNPTATDLQLFRSQLQLKARDNARTPFPWSPLSHGGFTSPSSTPWMSSNPDYLTCNAASQLDDPNSVYNFWASLISIRRKHKDLLVFGEFRLVDEEHESIFAYEKVDKRELGLGLGRERVLVVLNWKGLGTRWKVPETVRPWVNGGKVLMSNCGREEVKAGIGEEGVLELGPWEALLVLQRHCVDG